MKVCIDTATCRRIFVEETILSLPKRSESTTNQGFSVSLSVLNWVKQFPQTMFSGTLLQTKRGFLSPFTAWFLKPSRICHVIVSIRRGLILYLNSLHPPGPKHAFPESRVQKASRMGATVQTPLMKDRRKQSLNVKYVDQRRGQ